jgi:Bacterial trigger factor protein (TF) C-terminus
MESQERERVSSELSAAGIDRRPMGHGLAVDNAGGHRQEAKRVGADHEGRGLLLPVTSPDPHPRAALAGNDPPVIVLQFTQPVRASRDPVIKDRLTGGMKPTRKLRSRAEYRAIAERRVRLGLVLAQIGEKTDIKITEDEVRQALVERVRQYPGQEPALLLCGRGQEL